MDSGGGGGGATAIRVPYRHLRDAEMELVSLNTTNSSSPRAPKDHQPRREGEDGSGAGSRTGDTPKYRVVLACMVAAGVQFGWALQLSLLTPYIQVPYPSHLLHPPLALTRSRRNACESDPSG
jgi:solute carrier family 45 protein 1/2/4